MPSRIQVHAFAHVAGEAVGLAGRIYGTPVHLTGTADLLGVLDRRDKDAITLLFAAIPNYSFVKAKQKQKEIKDAGFQKSLPEKASPSAKYFWSARRSPVKKAPKVHASTHPFPA